MRGGARAERGKIVAALERRDEAPGAVARRAFGEALRRPGEIRLVELELRQRISAMRVEAGGDEEDIRAEGVERRQDDVAEGGAKLRGAGARPQRRVDDVADAALRGREGAGV